MHSIPTGTTTYEQMPPEFGLGRSSSNHKPWAFISIVIVVIIFGAFWYIENKQELPVVAPIVRAPVQMNPPAPDVQPVDLSILQASVVNSAIPDYSKDF